MIPRGIRNNNPGNIRYTGTKWIGLANPPNDGSFCRFTETKFGIRAIAKIIQNYNLKYGLNTVRKIIERWAPSSENETIPYINSVCRTIVSLPDDPLDLDIKMPLLCQAIIKHENGDCPYSIAEIKNGVNLC